MFAYFTYISWDSRLPGKTFSHLFTDEKIACPYYQEYMDVHAGAPVHATVWQTIYMNRHVASLTLCDELCSSRLPQCFSAGSCYHGCGHGFMAIQFNLSGQRPCIGPSRSSLHVHPSIMHKAEQMCSACAQPENCLSGVYHHFFKYAALEFVRSPMR